MPCRYDPTPQEIEQGKQRSKEAEAARRKVLDDLTADLCEARTLLVELYEGYTVHPTEVYDVLYAKHRDAHREHRLLDKGRRMQELSEEIVKEKDPQRLAELAAKIAKIAAVEGEELFTTDLF